MKHVAVKSAGRPVDEALWERRQSEILDAAARLFSEKGYADADTQALADILQVGKGTIYRYFPSKRDLFLAAVDRVMHRLRDFVSTSIGDVGEPLDQVTFGVRAYLTFFAQHPEFVELLIQERAYFKDRKRPTYFDHRDANVVVWQELYRRLIAEGRVRDIPVGQITDVISDLLYGTMFTNYFTGQLRSPEDQARGIIDIVFFGILAERGRESLRSRDTNI